MSSLVILAFREGRVPVKFTARWPTLTSKNPAQHLTSKNQVSTGQDVVSNINHVSDKGGSIGRLLKHESQSHLLNFLLVALFDSFWTIWTTTCFYVNLFCKTSPNKQDTFHFLCSFATPLLSLLPFPTLKPLSTIRGPNTWRHLLIKHGRISGGGRQRVWIVTKALVVCCIL